VYSAERAAYSGVDAAKSAVVAAKSAERDQAGVGQRSRKAAATSSRMEGGV
jgi:hypothetical protein